nr:hypothetical protein [Tanacetum cinerariifolium]
VNDDMKSKKKAVVIIFDPLALAAEQTKSDDKKDEKKVDEKKRDMGKVKCYNCKKEGHFAKDCKKAKVKDYEYYKTTMLFAKKDKDEQVLLVEDHAWMESSSDSDQEINANMVFMAQIEKVLSDSTASSSSSNDKIAKVSYYTSESKSKYEYETSDYYDNSTTYGLFVDNNDDQEIFHDSSEIFSENLIESQIDHNEPGVTHNDFEDVAKLINQMIKEFDKKIAKNQKRLEKANQQSKDFENQTKFFQEKCDVLQNKTNILRKQIAGQEILFDMMSRQLVEFNEDVRMLKNIVLEKDLKFFELEECVRNKDLEIKKCLERLNECENKLHKICQTNQTIHMIMPSKDKMYNDLKGIGFENPSHFCKAKDLRPTLYNERVIGLGNALCNAIMNASVDVNDLFVFDDASIRKSHVSKMPFRKKPSASLNVPSRSKLNKSLPRIMRKWISKLKPLVEPVAKWIPRIVQICFWIINLGCSKHMTGNRALLKNFMEKFLETVCFGNNDFAVIAGYGDVVIGSMTIKKVYYVEGLGHNLFSVGKFCDKGLEVAFQKSTYFVRTEGGVDLLTGDCLSNLYTIALNEVASNFLACLLAKASSSQSWLWHQRLSHLNFTTINNLVKNNLFRGLPKMRFEKDHLCSACEQGKIHRKHHKSKTDFASNKPLYFLHMDLCGSMRIESINGKRYELVVVYDYSWYTWRVRTDNGTEFKNKTLAKFFDKAKAIVTACFTQNRSIIHKRFDTTPYELMNKRKSKIKFFHVFGCKCYLLNDYDDVEKLKAKGDIGMFIGYSKESAAFRVYNKRNRKIHESVNVNFDELSEMASKQFSLEPGLTNLNETVKSSNLTVSQVSEASKKYLEDLFHNFYDEYLDSSKIMKSSTMNVETSNVEISSQEEEVFHESSESFQEKSSSSSLNDDVQQIPKEVILPQTNTQSISNDMIPNVDEASTSQNVFNERLEDAYFDASTSFHDPSIEPANVAEDLRDADWVSAMQDELDQFARLKVWRLVLDPKARLSSKPNGSSRIRKMKADWLQVNQFSNGIFINQSKYILDILKRFGMKNYDTVPTPMVEQAKLKLDLVGKQVDHTNYRSMIGSLMYVTSSRPDIMFATCMCARYQANPNEHHVSAIKRIFCYLKWTINLGLWYSKDSVFYLTAYSDADHAGCHLDQKSTSGSVQFLGDKLLCWSSKKKNCVSISTAESEYVVVFGCCAQVLWMRTQLTDYGFFYDKVPIYCDSKSAIAISCNPVQHTRTKHIDVRTGIDLPRSLPSNLGKLGLGDGV